MLHAHLIFSLPNPLAWRIRHFSKEPWFLLLESGIRSQHLDTGSQRFLGARVTLSDFHFHWVLQREPLGGGQRETVIPVEGITVVWVRRVGTHWSLRVNMETEREC